MPALELVSLRQEDGHNLDTSLSKNNNKTSDWLVLEKPNSVTVWSAYYRGREDNEEAFEKVLRGQERG